MPLKLFEFLEQFKIQFDHVFVTFTLLLYDSEVWLPFKKENEVNLKRNQKSNWEKSKLSMNKFEDFFLKKKNHLDLYKSIF